MQPQLSGGDQGQTAKALYDYQAGKYGDKLEKQHQVLKSSRKLKNYEMLICEVLGFPPPPLPKFPRLYISLNKLDTVKTALFDKKIIF